MKPSARQFAGYVWVTVAVVLGDAAAGRAELPGDLAKRFEFRNERPAYAAKDIELPAAKPWTDREIQLVSAVLEEVARAAPGLAERATADRPVRLYRVGSAVAGGAVLGNALVANQYEHSLVVPDGFVNEVLTTARRAEARGLLAHELAHLAEPASRLCFGKDWAELIKPRQDRVLARFREETGLDARMYVRFGPRTPARDARLTDLARAEGLPTAYAAVKTGEALAECTEALLFDRGYRPPREVKQFIESRLLKTPVEPDAANRAMHEALAARLAGDADLAIRRLDEALRLDPTWVYAYTQRARYWTLARRWDRAIADCDAALKLPGNVYRWGLVERADVHMAKGDHAAAVTDLTAALEHEPDGLLIYMARARAHGQLGNFDKAVEDFGTVIRLDPDHADAYAGRGLVRAARNEFRQAEGDFGEVIRRRPADPTAYMARGGTRFDLRKYDEAIADLNAVLRLAPGHVEATYFRGRCWQTKGEFDRAIEDYTAAARLDPRHAPAYFRRGECWAAKRQDDKALRDLDEAVRLEPRYRDAFYTRGLLRSARGEFDRAIREFDEVVRLDPGHVDALHGRAWARFERREFDQALTDFNEVIRLDPRNVDAFNNRGRVWHARGDLDRAARDYGEAIRLDPRIPHPYYNRGLVRAARKDYDLAIADFGEVIRLSPDGPGADARRSPGRANAFFQRGLARRDKKEFDLAVADFGEVVRLDPANAGAWLQRGLLWAAKNEPDKAVADLTEAIRLDPRQSDAFRARGEVWFAKKAYDKAVADYDEAARLNPWAVIAVTARRAVALDRLGRYDRAEQDYERAVKMHTQDAWVRRHFALFRAACPDGKYRDGKKAVELARAAIGLAGPSAWWPYQAALAAAHAEAGDFEAAVAAQQGVLKDGALGSDDRRQMEARLKLYLDRKPYRGTE